MRWMQGHYFVAWHYGPKLLVRFITTLKIQYLDYFLYLLNPLLIALSSALAFIHLGRLAFGAIPHQPSFWYSWLALIIVQNTYQIIIGPSLREGKLTLRYLPLPFLLHLLRSYLASGHLLFSLLLPGSENLDTNRACPGFEIGRSPGKNRSVTLRVTGAIWAFQK